MEVGVADGSGSVGKANVGSGSWAISEASPISSLRMPMSLKKSPTKDRLRTLKIPPWSSE